MRLQPCEYCGPTDFDYAVGIFVTKGDLYAPDSNHDRLQNLSIKNGAEVAGFPVACGTGLGYGDDTERRSTSPISARAR
jgi:hypothetical protein